MLLYGADEDVCRWVSEQLSGHKEWFRDSGAIGVVEGGNLIAGVVYSNYCVNSNHDPIAIEMSIASIDKRWCNRHNLRAFFKHPFIDLKVKRVHTLCSADNRDVVMFNKRLGFRVEGLHKEAWPHGGDALSWGMLRHECRYL